MGMKSTAHSGAQRFERCGSAVRRKCVVCRRQQCSAEYRGDNLALMKECYAVGVLVGLAMPVILLSGVECSSEEW
jgi:hypothetical protein